VTRFDEIRPHEIRFDCRFYSGYKPCGKADGCPDCAVGEPRGAEILVIKIGAMGDVLRTKCILPGLKRSWPQSRIAWITAPGSEPLVSDPLVDEVLALDAEGILALDGRRFDLVVCLDKEPAPLALSRRVDADRRLGFAPTPFNTSTVWNSEAEHALRLGLSDDLKFHRNTLTHAQILYGAIGLDYRGEDYSLEVAPEARNAAAEVLRDLGVSGERPLVGLNTGCGPVFETKGWTVEGFTAVARDLAGSGEADVLLLGGPRERDLHRQILRAVGGLAGQGVFDTGNRNPLEVFFGLLGMTGVVLTADSLALHAALALRRRVVAFFGPTCHQEVDLFDRGEKIVTDFACSPCYLKRCDVRPSCMQAMEPATVLAAVRRQLAAAGEAP